MRSNQTRQLGWTLALGLTLLACSEHADVSLTPAQQKKVEASLLATAPTPQHVVGAIIEDQVKLLGYDLDRAEVAPGETFVITYYLEVLADKPADNKIFVHLQGRENDRSAWMNLDHHPVEGLLPLRQTKKGQIVKDVQTVTVKPDFSPGDARIYWGLWRGDNRLKIKNAEQTPHDDKGRVVVASLKIKGDPSQPRVVGTLAAAQKVTAGETVNIDGKLDEPVWSRGAWTQYWTAPKGDGQAAPRTRARFAWDEQFLYVAVEAEDTDVWSTLTARDSNTWEQEVIEIFIDADGDQKDYLELQVTPANVVFDARFATHRSDLEKARAWNMEGFKSAAQVQGTLNQRDDVDTGYVVEMAIPAAQVPGAKAGRIAGSDVWRVNLFRWDWPKGEKQTAAAFSPPVVPDFHALDKFGRLRFVDGAAPGAIDLVPPVSGPASPSNAAPTSGAAQPNPGAGK